MDLEDFEVEFDLGDFLKNGAAKEAKKVSESITRASLGHVSEAADRAFSPPARNPAAIGADAPDQLERLLHFDFRDRSGSSKRFARNDAENSQKKAKTTVEEPRFVNFLDDDGMDWDVDPVTIDFGNKVASTSTVSGPRGPGTPREVVNLQSQTSARSEMETLPRTEDPRTQPGHRGKLAYKIPGPAGSVQFGILNDEPCEDPLKDPGQADTFDSSEFKSSAWLAALRYCQITELDPVKYSRRDSTISRIKLSSDINRVPQLVAIIKSCTPNGCGDAFVTLKDPTGTIDGTVHKKLLAETEFGRDIVPDAVILLCKVTVFRPSPRAHFLNITMHNVVQVFRR